MPELKALAAEYTPQMLSEIWTTLDTGLARRIFLALGIDKKADLISWLPDSEQEKIITFLSEQNTRLLVEEMEPDDLVDLMQSVSHEVRRSVWESLSDKAKRETLFLLRFDEDDAAGLMTPRYSAVQQGLTVAETIRFLKNKSSEAETIYYVYVVDKLNRLKGVLSLRQLIMAADETLVKDIMLTDPIYVREETDQEEVAQILQAHELIALPVVDEAGKLLGIVTFDDVMDVIAEEHTEDVYRMGAMGGFIDPYLSTSIPRLVWKRIPWLVLLLLLGTVTTNVLHHYETMIVNAAFLIMFLPVITQTGGNAGGQSSTLMIRGLATGEIQLRDSRRILWRELLVGVILGIATGAVIFLRSYLMPPGVELSQAIAIGSSLIIVVFFSTLVGTFAPILIARLGFDPTVMSAPLMATLIDVAGITIYFETAAYILRF
ncbi:MAG: magnesium transporter [Spirochaetales bacterium]|nr:magnesium transporter [Spirochaetales bacterium]